MLNAGGFPSDVPTSADSAAAAPSTAAPHADAPNGPPVAAPPAAAPPAAAPPAAAPPAAAPPAAAPPAAATPAAAPAAAATPAALRIVPINQLNLDQNPWTIKVSISSKSEIRHFYNTTGGGKVFSFDCIDEVSKAL